VSAEGAKQSPIKWEIASSLRTLLATTLCRYHPLQFYPRNYSRGVVAKLNFGGKGKTGDGSPAGLPLNCRFFCIAGWAAIFAYRNQRNN